LGAVTSIIGHDEATLLALRESPVNRAEIILLAAVDLFFALLRALRRILTVDAVLEGDSVGRKFGVELEVGLVAEAEVGLAQKW
jgi:hypothetical protein